MPPHDDQSIERAIKRLCKQVDPEQPYGRQLEQIAGAAVGYGLRKATKWRERRAKPLPGLRGKIEMAVAGFADARSQDALDEACRQSGVSQADVLAGVVLKHCHQDLTPLTAEQVARYGLEFALMLAESSPELARRYRRRLARSGRPG